MTTARDPARRRAGPRASRAILARVAVTTVTAVLLACGSSSSGSGAAGGQLDCVGTQMGTLTFSLGGTTGASDETVVFSCATPGQ